MDNHKDLSKFWLFLILLLSLFLITYFNHFHKDWPNPNETVRLYLALSIVERGEFNIDNEINKYGVIWDRAVYKNKTYSDKAPGVSFAAVPTLYISKIIHKHILKKTPSLKTSYILAILSTSVLLTLISLVFLLKLFDIYNLSFSTSFISLLTLVTGTYAGTYSMLFFGHQFSSALLFISFVLIEIYIRKKRNPFYVIFAAFLTSYAFISEYPTIFLSVIMFFYLLVETKEKRVILYSLSAIIPVLLLMYYFNTCFGSPFSTGYQHLDSETFARIHKEGLLGFKYPSLKAIGGLLFGSQRGLLFFSPVLLLSFFYLLKSGLKSGLTRFILIMSFTYLFLISSFGYWIGGDAAGARHLMPLNYFLIIPIAFFLEERQKNPLIMSIFFGLLFVSIHNIVVTNISWPFFPPQFLNPLGDFAYIIVNDGYITHSISNLFGIYGYSSVAVFLLVLSLILIGSMIFYLRDCLKGYIIVAEIFIIWVLFILILFPSKPDEGNYREIKRIENSFDPKPNLKIPFEKHQGTDYRICIKRGNVLLRSGSIYEALREYRCKR